MTPPTSSLWLRMALRFVAAIAVLSVVGSLYGARWIERALPLMMAELEWLDDTYHYRSISLKQVGSAKKIWLEVSQARTITLGEQVFVPDERGRASASTQWAHPVLPAALVLACALAWPLYLGAWPGATRVLVLLLFRGMAALVGVALVMALDVPMVLWAGIWDLHVQFAQPDRFSPLLIWREFMDGGGRQALGLALGCSGAWLTSQRRSPPTTAPQPTN